MKTCLWTTEEPMTYSTIYSGSGSNSQLNSCNVAIIANNLWHSVLSWWKSNFIFFICGRWDFCSNPCASQITNARICLADICIFGRFGWLELDSIYSAIWLCSIMVYRGFIQCYIMHEEVLLFRSNSFKQFRIVEKTQYPNVWILHNLYGFSYLLHLQLTASQLFCGLFWDFFDNLVRSAISTHLCSYGCV